jgi:hypothetical protein
MVLVPIVAVKAAEPGATALIVKVALDDPDGTFSVAGTVATAALLLASVTAAPAAGAAALSVTVPCPLAPTVTLAGVSVTDATAVFEPGDVVEPPHCAVLRRPRRAAENVTDERKCPLTYFMPDATSTSVPHGSASITLHKPAQRVTAPSSTASRSALLLLILLIL